MFGTAQEAELSYESGIVKLQDLAEYRPMGREGGHVLTTVGRIIYNDRIERALQESLGDTFDPDEYAFVNQSVRKRDTVRVIDDARAAVRRAGGLAGARRVQGPRASATRRSPASRSPRTT